MCAFIIPITSKRRGHLHFVAQHSDEKKHSLSSVSNSWGGTCCYCESGVSSFRLIQAIETSSWIYNHGRVSFWNHWIPQSAVSILNWRKVVTIPVPHITSNSFNYFTCWFRLFVMPWNDRALTSWNVNRHFGILESKQRRRYWRALYWSRYNMCAVLNSIAGSIDTRPSLVPGNLYLYGRLLSFRRCSMQYAYTYYAHQQVVGLYCCISVVMG